ncbi:MAG: 2-octaprenyl-6-methoxyphenyl hydroxylase [Pseudomonadota bacterium]
MSVDYDIFISGAGMVGSSLALSLASTGLKIGLIDATSLKQKETSTFDVRGITLSLSSKRIFENLGLWQRLQQDAFPIKQIHISEKGKFAFTHLHASEAAVDNLGFVVVASALGKTLHGEILKHKNIDFICPAELRDFHSTESSMHIVWSQHGEEHQATTSLLIGADGTNSTVRRLADIKTTQHDFNQTAFVANVITEKSNNATAYERFTPHGPIALLPIKDNQSVLVFVVDNDEIGFYQNLDDKSFIQCVQGELGRRLGKIIDISERRSYPISFHSAESHFQQNLLLLGNAAHTLHPNAAQGFNLGLRDVAGFVDAVNDGLAKGLKLNNKTILQNYYTAREADQKRITYFTNGLARCFYNQLPVLDIGRGLAMLITDILPPAKSQLMQTAMGIIGKQPELVREVS